MARFLDGIVLCISKLDLTIILGPDFLISTDMSYYELSLFYKQVLKKLSPVTIKMLYLPTERAQFMAMWVAIK